MSTWTEHRPNAFDVFVILGAATNVLVALVLFVYWLMQ